MTSDEKQLAGGCLCGAIRYRTRGMPMLAEYCHCRMCQKAAGAAFGNWMDFEADRIEWIGDRPEEYQSSSHVHRGFCGRCGSSLTFRNEERPQHITLTINSLDDPDQVVPTQHIYTDSQVVWLELTDGCARFATQSNRQA